MDDNAGGVRRVVLRDEANGGFYLVGRHSSPETHDLRTFLVRNRVPFRWVDVDTDPLVGFLRREVLPPSVRWPVCLFEDGSSLENPSRLELARKVGLHTRPSLPEYDLAIVGAGPAGLTAAVYAASEGLRTLVIEREAPGGQAGTSARIENYPGFPEGISGMEFTERALKQALRFGAELILGNQVTGFKLGHPTIHYLADGSEFGVHSVIVATGVAYRRLDAPGVEELTGRGVYYGSALTEAAAYRGKEVWVVGGGNSAGQLALHLAGYARAVTMLVRGADLAQSMSRYLIDRLRATPNIRLWFGTKVLRAGGDDRLRSLVLDREGKELTVPADALFILIGQRPATQWAEGYIARDPQGFLLTGPDVPRGEGGWYLQRDPLPLETSGFGLFAAGDVRHGSINRVAWAVGEGAMAVQLVHHFLNKLMLADVESLFKQGRVPPRLDLDMTDRT